MSGKQDRFDELAEAARAAWIFTLPMVEMTSPQARGFLGGAAFNRFARSRELVDHTSRSAPAPNNDTLYCSSHLDLAAGPVTLTLPACGKRYLSAALIDAYGNNFSILGTRTTGTEGGRFTICGPQDKAKGDNVIRSPSRHVWLLSRLLVDGPHDLEAALGLQDQILLEGPAIDEPGPEADTDRNSAWKKYFRRAAWLLHQNSAAPDDAALLRAIAPLRLDSFAPSTFTEEEGRAIARGVELARAQLKQALSHQPGFVDGWSYPPSSLGNFGQAYLYRAAIAVAGRGALPPEEAIYMRAAGDGSDGLLDGNTLWRLHFPAGRLIPVRAFWSMSLYEVTPEGQLFFTENPLKRYSIGDRLPGLCFNADGSLDLWIGHASPGAGKENNWLPAPAGPFALLMRAYLPDETLLNGSYRLPPVEMVRRT